MSTVVQNASVEYLEQLLHRASIDADFHDLLLSNPDAFGVPANTPLDLPGAVEKPDESFFNLFNDALGELNIVAQCKSSCSFGPYTVVCDGGTK
jgi:Family of unknown function (DUF5973)